MKEYALDILTPAGEAFSGMVGQLFVKTTSGEVGILADHTEYLAGVVPCVARVFDGEGHSRRAFCGGGFVSVVKGKVSVVVDEFVFGAQLSAEEERSRKDSLKEELAKCDAKKEPERASYLKTALTRAEEKCKAAKG